MQTTGATTKTNGNVQQADVIQTAERSSGVQIDAYGRWFRRSRDRSSPSLRLLCFPHAGGSARMFHDWYGWCRPEVEVVAVELPGRGRHSDSPPIDRMNSLVERLLPAIQPLLDKPFALFGHSMGALIAFELARALNVTGRRTPLHLFASAMRPPHVKGQYWIHKLPDSQLVEALRALNGTPEEVFGDTSSMEFFLPLLRADLRLVETYQYAPGPRLDHPITVFGGVGDFTTPVEQLHEWQRHTRSGCTLRLLHGNHFFIQQHAHLMAASILKSLGGSSLPTEFEPAEGSRSVDVLEVLEVEEQVQTR